jgi:hypothetical protein
MHVNTTSYNVQSHRPNLLRSLSYRLENRPLVSQRNGLVTSLTFRPKGEQTDKACNNSTTWFSDPDGESRSATSMFISTLHPDVRRGSSLTELLVE